MRIVGRFGGIFGAVVLEICGTVVVGDDVKYISQFSIFENQLVMVLFFH